MIASPHEILTSQSLLDEAYEEYCRQLDDGVRIVPDEFLRRYPSIRSSLGRLLELHEAADRASRRAELPWPKVGETFLGFELLARLGRGAFAQVFLAAEPALGNRKVAVKITSRAAAEAFTLGRINHPNITPIHSTSFDRVSGLATICMPYLGSATLLSLLDRIQCSAGSPANASVIAEAAADPFGPATGAETPRFGPQVPYEEGIRTIFAEICGALAALHANGIVHHDLKPSNVLLRPDGTPVLLDFNLAADPLAQSSSRGGTLLYMSPEQLAALEGDGTARIDFRSDLYSLGILLWETLVGAHPFGPFPAQASRETLTNLLRERQNAGPAAPNRLAARTKTALLDVAAKLLRRNPNDRYLSAEAVAQTLVPRRRRPRKPWLMAAAAACVLAIGGGAWHAASNQNSAGRSELPSESGWDRYREGAKRFRDQDFDGAIEHFSKAIAAMPTEPRAWTARCQAYLAKPNRGTDDLNRALADIQSAGNLGRTLEYYSILGYVSHLMKQNGAADACYAKILDESTGPNPAVKNNFAVLKGQFSRHDEALRLVNEALAEDPNSTIAYCNRAFIYFDKGIAASPASEAFSQKSEFLRLAAIDFQRAANSEPENGELQYQLAKVLAYSESDNPATQKRVLEHLARAIDHGVDPKRLRFDGAWKGLRTLETFKNLAARTPAAGLSPAFSRLVNPVPAIAPPDR